MKFEFFSKLFNRAAPAQGPREWSLDGRLYKPQGPGLIHADGSEEWFTPGVMLKPVEPSTP